MNLKSLKTTHKNTIFIIMIITFAMGVGLFRGKASINTHTPKNNQQEMTLQTGTLLPTPKSLPDFNLTATNQQAFTPKNFKKHWSFVFFGYSHCPDICPQSLAWLKDISEAVSPGPIVQYIFMSIDPERDSIQQLEHFLEQPRFKSQNTQASFLGVTGDKKEIIHLAESMGLFAAEKPTNTNPESYTLDHSGTLVLINPEGKLTAIFTRPDNAHAVAQDFITLVQKSQDKHPGNKPYVLHD